jgi:catechol 2,3-dioxygenase-like lactoylglutathione lyase family enzyme
MSARIGYANIYVSDLDRAVDFYHRVLGLPLLFRADQFSYARLDAGPIHLGLAAVDRAAENFAALVGRHTGIGLAVPDIDRAYEELSAKGVEFPMLPSEQHWGGRLALLADPDGNGLYLDRIVESARA